MIEIAFSTVKILAQRPTHISAVATVLLITKTLTETERERDRDRETERQTDRQRQRQRRQRGNSELYYTMIKNFGSCLFLQSVPANLQTTEYRIFIVYE